MIFARVKYCVIITVPMSGLRNSNENVSRGENLLFADADGATTFADLTKLERCLEEITRAGEGVVCGSRAHLEQESVAQRTAVRTLLMYGFHACVWMFAVKTVKDTQCGFKVSIKHLMLLVTVIFITFCGTSSLFNDLMILYSNYFEK